MKEQVSVDENLKDPTDKIKVALDKITFLKNKIYINADEHTFQPHIIEIINLLTEATNICMDNIIKSPFQRIKPAALVYKDELERLKRVDENARNKIEEYKARRDDKNNTEEQYFNLRYICELLEGLYK